jgi:PAS domain S-box-containing protein
MMRVLLVEDSPAQAETLRLMLEAEGVEVESVSNAETGLDALRGAPFDLVISDVMMPDMSGYDLCRSIKGDPALQATPVILLTALSGPVDIMEGLACGADNFITKPYDPGYLLDQVNTFLEGWRLRSAGGARAEVKSPRRSLVIDADKEQIFDLLRSAFTGVVRANRRLQAREVDLATAKSKVERYARELERQASFSNEKYRTLMTHASEAIFVVASDDTVIEVNHRAESLLKRHANELVGLTYSALVAPADRNYAQTLFRKLIDEGSATVHDLHLLRRGADPVVVDVSASRVKTQGRHVVLAITRDVTERNLLQQRMLQNEKLATVGVLSAGLAHEINTPTAVVLANLGALEGHVQRLRAALAEIGAIAAEAPPELRKRLEGVVNEGLSAAATAEFNEILHDCQHAGERVRDIVRDLKSFSHIDEGEVALVDLHERLDTSVRMAANEVRYRARVEKYYDRELPPVVASPGKLNQLFLNLIVNAAQAIEVGRAAHNKIVITTGVEGDRLRVDIADTGAGIAPDALNKLFEPFFTTKAVGVGTGLGLFICHDIVKQHGGELRVESKPGAGTTFTVFLPRHTGFEVRRRATPAPVEPVTRARVLVVDDEAFLLRAYQRTLGGQHDVTIALGGRAALEALCLTDTSFDVIFCDLMMPDVDGVDVYRYVAEKRPELVPRLVFITGGAYTTRVQDFLASVDNPRLEKPFSTEELQRAIANVCARGSLGPHARGLSAR